MKSQLGFNIFEAFPYPGITVQSWPISRDLIFFLNTGKLEFVEWCLIKIYLMRQHIPYILSYILPLIKTGTCFLSCQKLMQYNLLSYYFFKPSIWGPLCSKNMEALELMFFLINTDAIKTCYRVIFPNIPQSSSVQRIWKHRNFYSP